MCRKIRSSNLHAALIRLGVAFFVLTLAIVIFLWRLYRSEYSIPHEATVIPPTCTESGYTLYTYLESNEVDIRDIVPATGHSYGPWEEANTPVGTTCGFLRRICTVCGETDEQTVYPELGVPLLALHGSLDGIGKKSEVNLTASYFDSDLSLQFECYASLKYQGHESLGYEKKNYTLKLFEDSLHQKKLKLQLEHWNSENKYILKANYIDTTSCRNLVCADVWADICKERATIPVELETASNYGAVDGYPVAVYINDQFEGLYTMNLHKDEDLYCMEDGEKQAVLISNHAAASEAYFRAQAAFTDSSPWEVEYCGTEDQTWVQEQLNELIDFVLTADDEKFRTELNRYLDVDSAVDYLIAVYALGLTNNGSQNLILISYDTPWIASMYDMENAFGLNLEGTEHYEPEQFLPIRTADGWDSATGSLLWDRLLKSFEPEFRARYAQLRQRILNPDALCTRVEQFTGAIPDTLYEAEWEAWPRAFSDTGEPARITSYIRQRITALDNIFMEGETKS